MYTFNQKFPVIKLTFHRTQFYTYSIFHSTFTVIVIMMQKSLKQHIHLSTLYGTYIPFQSDTNAESCANADI